mgnify:FL=1
MTTPAKWEEHKIEGILMRHATNAMLGKITTEEGAKEIHQLLSDYKSRLLSKVEGADIAEDKVGTFQDGYRCFKAQVIALIRKEN